MLRCSTIHSHTNSTIEFVRFTFIPLSHRFILHSLYCSHTGQMASILQQIHPDTVKTCAFGFLLFSFFLSHPQSTLRLKHTRRLLLVQFPIAMFIHSPVDKMNKNQTHRLSTELYQKYIMVFSTPGICSNIRLIFTTRDY